MAALWLRLLALLRRHCHPRAKVFVGPCHCATRKAAEAMGALVFSVALGGYIMPDDRSRRRDGAPFVWVTCPYCGGELLEVKDDARHP